MRTSIPALLSLLLLAPTAASAVVCPSGFLEVIVGTASLGCIQESEEATAPTPSAVLFPGYLEAMNLCQTQYGGRLPTTHEALQAVNTLSPVLTDLQDDEPEYLADLLTGGDITPTCTTGCAEAAGFSFGATVGNQFWFQAVRTRPGAANVRCFIPAESLPEPIAAVIPGWAALVIAAMIAGHTSWHRLRRS